TVCAICVLANHGVSYTLPAESRSAEFTVTTTDARIDGDTLADSEARNFQSNLTNDTSGITSNDLWHRHFDSGHSSAEKNVDVINRRRLNFDHHVTPSGGRFRHGWGSKNFGVAMSIKNDCFHTRQLVYPTFHEH